mmetsp:Transcript_8716/g.26119  ORF Transcript_8716/g.26119 Transcript_8716/m.26119 type:complete len:123 (+) Transcript_8716:367-735(+)
MPRSKVRRSGGDGTGQDSTRTAPADRTAQQQLAPLRVKLGRPLDNRSQSLAAPELTDVTAGTDIQRYHSPMPSEFGFQPPAGGAVLSSQPIMQMPMSRDFAWSGPAQIPPALQLGRSNWRRN